MNLLFFLLRSRSGILMNICFISWTTFSSATMALKTFPYVWYPLTKSKVGLYDPQSRLSFLTFRLMAIAWVPPPTNKGIVFHSRNNQSISYVRRNHLLDSNIKGKFSFQRNPMHFSTSSAVFTSPPPIPEDSIRVDEPLQRNNNMTIQIDLSKEEEELFDLLRAVMVECGMKSTLRVAGGWVRDKILACREFQAWRMQEDNRVKCRKSKSGNSEPLRCNLKNKGKSMILV